MVEYDRQDGPNPEQLALRDQQAAPRDQAAQFDAPAAVIAAAVLDDAEDDGTALPPLPPQSQDAPEAPVLETDAAPPAAQGGGTSSYSGDFGALIDGLQANDEDEATQDNKTPGNRFGLPTAGGGDTLFLAPLTPAKGTGGEAVSGTDGDNTVGAGGDDTGGDDTGSGGGDSGSGGDDTGAGAAEALFTNHPDSVDFNDIDAGSYLDGTQYDALSQNDLVILPTDAGEAAEAGFVPGTAFLAGNGNDTVTGGGLADSVDGGSGSDLLAGGVDDDSLAGGSGIDSLDGGIGNDLLDGGSGDDSLTAGDGDDTLAGGNGQDSLDGGVGNDLLDGGNGNDLLVGGLGDDSLIGGANNDTFFGGLGDDVMTGGSGKDVFSYSLATDEGNDLILDFKTGKGGDHLQISDLTDVNNDSFVDLGDLDAGANSVVGTADAIVITFDGGTTITLDGLDGSGVNSFAGLVDNAKVNVDIL